MFTDSDNIFYEINAYPTRFEYCGPTNKKKILETIKIKINGETIAKFVGLRFKRYIDVSMDIKQMKHEMNTIQTKNQNIFNISYKTCSVVLVIEDMY